MKQLLFGQYRRQHMVEPFCALLHGDVRIVDRVQNVIKPDVCGVELEEMCRKVPGRRLKEVVLEVKGDVLLHRHANGDLTLKLCGTIAQRNI